MEDDMSSAVRTILHADMDAFYVSVELIRRPELRGKPVVVGGSGERGVVAAASYEARAYGVYSAMSSVVARRRCPEAVFLEGDHGLYSEVSIALHDIFDRFTPLVEPIALDEAFLDVTGTARLQGKGVEIAAALRQAVHTELELGCSVGVAPNKFIAKLASEAAKPSASRDGPIPGTGIVEVAHDQMISFLHPHDVKAVWGVGPATLKRLHGLGVETVADLAAVPVDALIASLGKAQGRHLHELSHARDDRAVEASRGYKSIGHEETFPSDIYELGELESQLVRMCDAVASRVRKQGVVGKTIQIKMRFGNFDTITRSVTLIQPTDSTNELIENARVLLRRENLSLGVRLLGVSLTGLSEEHNRQLSLDDVSSVPEASGAMDAIRDRFGTDAIAHASALSKRGINVKMKGKQQWGPKLDQ